MAADMLTPVLAVDTSGEVASVALVAPGRSNVVAQSEPGERAGQSLHRLVARVLEEAGLELADVGRLVAVRGPGSFTGLRVGLAAMQGLAMACGRPGIGLETTRVIARAWDGRGEVLVLLDGGQGRLFSGRHVVDADSVTTLDGPEDVSPDEALARVRGRAGHAVLRGTPASAADLVAAGCAPFAAPLAPAAARLALRQDEAAGTLVALYAREPAIRRPKAPA